MMLSAIMGTIVARSFTCRNLGKPFCLSDGLSFGWGDFVEIFPRNFKNASRIGAKLCETPDTCLENTDFKHTTRISVRDNGTKCVK